jgi:hypothetical protein
VDRLVLSLFLIIFCCRANGAIVLGKSKSKVHSIAVSNSGLTDFKVDRDNDGLTDLWMVSQGPHFQVHWVSSYRIKASILYEAVGDKLFRAEIVSISDSKAKVRIAVLKNPTMHLLPPSEPGGKIADCNSHNGISDQAQDLANIANSIHGGKPIACSGLDESRREALDEWVDILLEEPTQNCFSIAVQEIFPGIPENGIPISMLKAQLKDYRENENNGAIVCTNGRSDPIKSNAPPLKITIALQDGSLDKKVSLESLRHEYAHQAVRLSCLALNPDGSCSKISTDDPLITKLEGGVVECLKGKRRPNEQIQITAPLVNQQNPQLMSAEIAPTEGAELAKLEINVSEPQMIKTEYAALAYMPAASAEATGSEKTFVNRTVRVGRDALDRGDRFWDSMKRAIGDELKVIPRAGADTQLAELDEVFGVKRTNRSFTVTSVDVNTGSRRVQVPESGKSQKNFSIVGTADSNSDREIRNSDEKGPTRSDKLSRVESIGSSAEMAAGGRSGLTKSGTGVPVQGNSGTQLARSNASPPDRRPDSINQGSISAAEVVRDVKTRTGGELLKQIESNEKEYGEALEEARIALYDFDDNVYGADPDGKDGRKAKSCYIIRSIKSRATPINCTNLRSRKKVGSNET